MAVLLLLGSSGYSGASQRHSTPEPCPRSAEKMSEYELNSSVEYIYQEFGVSKFGGSDGADWGKEIRPFWPPVTLNVRENYSDV
jgi:hypothetical protein